MSSLREPQKAHVEFSHESLTVENPYPRVYPVECFNGSLWDLYIYLLNPDPHLYVIYGPNIMQGPASGPGRPGFCKRGCYP